MHCRHKQIHNRPHRRRGTLYIGVMMTALIVAVIGLSGLAVSHLGIETAQNTRDAETAAILARAAAEELVRQLNTNPLWRSIVVSGNESTFVGGGGAISTAVSRTTYPMASAYIALVNTVGRPMWRVCSSNLRRPA
jgi:Tfp pilus assembly protein PilX